MNDTRAPYDAGNALPMTLDAYRNRGCSRPWSDPGYTHPSPEEVAQLIRLAGWSTNEAADIVGVKRDVKHGSATIRKWKSAHAGKTNREIPYSAWRLMLLHAGVVELELVLRG